MADPSTERDPLELLAAEYMDRLRQGQSPSIDEYAAQHPSLAEEIRELFPTITITERLKARQERSSGGRATLGPNRLERLGDFRIIREIGRGGMGVVFEAEQESLGRRVAVKVLPRQVLLDEKSLKRFEREARIAANLHHTNIVEVFGVGEQDGFHYYVMQYIEGVGLDSVIPLLANVVRTERSGQPPSPSSATAAAKSGAAAAAMQSLLGREHRLHPGGHLGSYYWRSVARIAWQSLDALEYAHVSGTLHRDIKPANLLLDTQGTVWLTDFGLAKATHSQDISLSRDVVGTLRYMAPEQFRGNSDRRSDIYSLGLTLYELLALRPAYEESDQSRLIHRISQGPPPMSPSSSGVNVPRDLETIVLKAISHDASQRYQSAAEMGEDIRSFLEDRPIRARRVGPVERLGRWCRRNKALAALTGSTLVSLVLVALVATVGYVRTKAALQEVEMERGKAEVNARLALEALDRIFERLSPTPMRVVPQASFAGADGDAFEVPVSTILSKDSAALLQEMLPFYDRLAQQTGNDEKLQARIAEANWRVGAIRQRLGQFDQATLAYQRATELYRELLARSPGNASFKLGLAQIQNELGRLYTAKRLTSQARDAHLAAAAQLQDGGISPTLPEALRFELARAYYFLGTQERPLPAAGSGRGDRPSRTIPEQRDRLAAAVALLRVLTASPDGNPEYHHLLALCYLEGAPVEEDRPSATRAGADRAIEILENLVRTFPGNPDYAFDLSEAYARIRIPRPPIPPETQKVIEERFGKSLALLEKLVAQHPDIPDFRAAKARIHDKLGSFHRQMDDWEDAEQSFRKAIAIQAPLVEQFPNMPSYSLWLATFRIALADTMIRRNHPEEARKELEETISMLLRQLEQKPDLSRPHDLLALGYSRLAIALRQTGEKDKADETERKAEQERTGPNGTK